MKHTTDCSEKWAGINCMLIWLMGTLSEKGTLYELSQSTLKGKNLLL